MYQIAVFDYNKGGIEIYSLTERVDAESFLEEKGHRINDCIYMVSIQPIIPITIHAVWF